MTADFDDFEFDDDDLFGGDDFAFDDDIGGDFESDYELADSSTKSAFSAQDKARLAKMPHADTLMDVIAYPHLAARYLSTLTDTNNLRDTLHILVTLQLISRKLQVRSRVGWRTSRSELDISKYCQDISQDWIQTGDYKSAFSTSIVASIYNRTGNFGSIADFAIEKNQVNEYISAIAQHRATQAVARAYLDLLFVLLFKLDGRRDAFNEVFKRLTHQLEKISNPLAKFYCLFQLNLFAGATDTDGQFQILARQRLEQEELEPKDKEEFSTFLDTIVNLISEDNIRQVHDATDQFFDQHSSFDAFKLTESVFFGNATKEEFWGALALGDKKGSDDLPNWLLFLTALPPQIAIKYFDTFSALMEKSEEDNAEIIMVRYIIPMGIHALSSRQNVDALLPILIFDAIDGDIDDFFSIRGFEEFLDFMPLIFTLTQRYKDFDFTAFYADLPDTFELLKTLELEREHKTFYLMFNILKLLNKQHVDISSEIEQLIQAMNSENVVDTILPLMSAFIFEQKVDTAEQLYTTEVFPRIKTEPEHLSSKLTQTNVTSRTKQEFKAIYEPPAALDADDAKTDEHEQERGDLPVDRIALVIFALLARDQSDIALKLLQPLSIQGKLRILRALFPEVLDKDEEEINEGLDELLPLMRDLSIQFLDILRDVSRKVIVLIQDIILEATFSVADDLELIETIDTLEAHGVDKARCARLAQQISHNASRDAMLKAFNADDTTTGTSTKRITGTEFQSTDLDFGDVPDLQIRNFRRDSNEANEEDAITESTSQSLTENKHYQAIVSLCMQGNLSQAFDLAKSIDSLVERANVMRTIAQTLAHQHHANAKAVFDEAIRIARAHRSTSFAGIKGDNRQKLIVSKMVEDTDSVLALVNKLDTSQPDRYQDMTLHAVILGLIQLEQYHPALTLLEKLRVDPWRIGSQTALIGALIAHGQLDDATTILHAVEGKQNRMQAMCAYGVALWSTDQNGAEAMLQQAEALMHSFSRPYHQLEAQVHYAKTLLQIGHTQADDALAKAFTSISTYPDMLSRFDLLLDLADTLLAIHHPQSEEVLTQLEAIIFEAAEANRFAQSYKEGYRWAEWASVANNMSFWEIDALISLARMLTKHNHHEDVQRLIDRARETSKAMGDLPWGEVTPIIQTEQFKHDIENLGSRTLSEVTEIILSLEPILRNVSEDLFETVSQNMFRLFQWIEYDPREITRYINVDT